MPEISDHELAVLLREDRPQPSDDFARSLDARVARGFVDPHESAPRARRSLWARITPLFSIPVLGMAATVALVVVLAVTAPFGSDDGGAGDSGSVASTELAEPQPGAADSAGGGGSSEDAGDARSDDGRG